MKSNQRSTLYALHGFLGLPTDWEFLSPASIGVKKIEAFDLFQSPVVSCRQSLWGWAKQFNDYIKSLPPDGPRILMGYSLGGRLAMHALIQEPSMWSMAILVSANPGYSDTQKKQKRIEEDSFWASRFEKEAWEIVMRDWNQRGVFSGGISDIPRFEKDYCRISLSHILQQWSLGRQDDLIGLVQQLPMPILWMAGDRDHHYAALANAVSLRHPESEVWIASGAGHRIPWDQQLAFKEKVKEVMEKSTNCIKENL